MNVEEEREEECGVNGEVSVDENGRETEKRSGVEERKWRKV